MRQDEKRKVGRVADGVWRNRRARRHPQSVRQHLCLLIAVLSLTLFSQPSSTAAQSQAPYYWNYTTSGQWQQMLTADVNHDGVDEFLLATAAGRVELISADGFAQWSYDVGAPALALGVVNVDGRAHPPHEIVIGRANQLILLNDKGELLWQAALESSPPPFGLMSNGSRAAQQAWQNQYSAIPIQIAPLDYNNDGQDEILLLLQSGQMQLFDATGQRIWQYNHSNVPLTDATPRMFVNDTDGDGRPEIILGYFNPDRRFSRLVRIEPDGREAWERAVSGRITALTSGQFAAQGLTYIAVGTSLGNVDLYHGSGQKQWPRTVNRQVTDLTFVPLDAGAALAASTNSGTVVLFDNIGRRQWVSHLSSDASRAILYLSAATFVNSDNDPILAAALAPATAGGAADLLLLGSNGRTLRTFTDTDQQGITRLVDINRDGHSELLLAQFPNLQLIGLGIGVSATAQEWSRELNAIPLSYLVVDFNQDGQDDLLVGTNRGRLYRLNNDGSADWIINPGGDITHLATLTTQATAPTNIVMARSLIDENGDPSSWLEVRHDNGEKIWEQWLPTRISSLLVENLNDRGDPEIIVGTDQGDVIVYSAAGVELWQNQIPGAVRHLRIIDNLDPQYAERYELIVANENEIYKVRDNSQAPNRIAVYLQPITNIYALQQPGNELSARLLVLVADGFVYGLNWRGILLPPWPIALGSPPLTSIAVTERLEDIFEIHQARAESFLIATDNGNLVHVRVENNRPTLVWRMSGLGNVTSLHWGDVDGDSLQDIAIGSARKAQLFTREPAFVTELNLASNPLGLTLLRRDANQSADLTVIMENGVVQLFRAQENWPPLLFAPDANVRPGQYGVSVNVIDVEGDRVQVRLEVQDPNTLRWLPQEERLLNGGNGQVPFLLVNPPAAADGVRYRFHYADAFHEGIMTPPPGPLPIIPAPLFSTSRTVLAVLSVFAAATAVVLIRQAQSPAARARRFHRRLRQQPDLTLLLLENKYSYTGGSPDFLLYLTSQARQSGDWLIASLGDGLFLLADRPHAALSILNSALDEIAQRKLNWQCLERWQMTYKTGQALLEAPSIIELMLLRPQFEEMLSLLEEKGEWSPTLELLLPILTNLRDSERVELVEDRLVYLNEAASLLALVEEQLPEFSDRIEKTLVKGISARWSGMIGARIEELRGRAELVITLKTKQLTPNGRTDVAVEIHNKGRAAAEQVVAVLDEKPAYLVHSAPQIVPLIPPGRARLVSFAIEPQVADHFRIALTLTYSDRNQKDKTAAFGDMVHLLAPARDFTPIPNPYIPGSPLRRDSALFYGRQEIFNFIAANVGLQTQRNVLILVGQRRTGKTSALLQLEHHLPDTLLPVYIDCQSLGVSPGLSSLFNELAWLIADALSNHHLDVVVPEPDAWLADPALLFQRHFLPHARALLPPDSTLLLVFDEFESLQSLVEDGLLPASFFPYLRHLMQHSEGLGFIFVGTHRLEEMSADYWSVLFNIALYEKIGYLSRGSALRLITEPVAPTLLYDDLALDKILRVTAGHPYFLQLVCYTLVKRANTQRSGYVTISDVNAALDEMLRLGEVHFAYLWQRSSAAERAILTAVTHLMDPDLPYHPEDIVAALIPYDIRLSPAEVTGALNMLVERDIMREVTEGGKTVYELQIGLVGLWVAKNKSLSKLLYSNSASGVGRRASEEPPVHDPRPMTPD